MSVEINSLEGLKYLKENYDNWDRASKEKSFESPLNETKKLNINKSSCVIDQT